jgi:hypothetical protein
VGPLKGQRKLCSKCPSLATLSTNDQRRLCDRHRQELIRAKAARLTHRRSARRMAYWLPLCFGPPPPPSDHLLARLNSQRPSNSTRRKAADYEIFEHLPPEQRERAWGELERLMRRHRECSPQQYAARVALAAQFARQGGYTRLSRRRELTARQAHHYLGYAPAAVAAYLNQLYQGTGLDFTRLQQLALDRLRGRGLLLPDLEHAAAALNDAL